MIRDEKGRANQLDFLPLPRIFLIIAGVLSIIITLYLLMMYDRISSSVQEAAMAAIFFVALPTVYITFIYKSLKRQMAYIRATAPKLEMLGLHFSAAQSRLALVLEGHYDDHKIQFSPFSLGKDRFDFYMITFVYQSIGNLGLLCTNTGYLIGKNALSISFRQQFGLKKTAIPGIYDSEIKCWIQDENKSLSIFHDDRLKFAILKLNEVLKSQNACFVLDDQNLRIAFPVNVLPESASLEAAKDLCNALRDLGLPAQYSAVEPERKADNVRQKAIGREQILQ